MGVISGPLFKALSDRIGAQTELIVSGLGAARAQGDGYRYDRIISGIDATTDYDVVSVMINPARALDQNIANNITLASIFTSAINSDKSQITGKGYSNIDTYLSGLNINVSSQYEMAYYAATGQHLDAIDVFGPSINMALEEMASSGVGTFTAGNAIGTGTGKASGTNYAGAQVEAFVVSGLGANDLELKLYCKIENGSIVERTATIPNTATSGDTIDFGSSTDNIIEITNILAAGGDTGDVILIRSKLERTISL